MTEVGAAVYPRPYWAPVSKDPDPEGPALISPQLPAPRPARRPEPYGSESRAYSSERGVEFTLDSEWNNGILESKADGSLIL
jgi:hypothetical protein